MLVIRESILTFPLRTNSLNVGHRLFTSPALVKLWVLASRYRIGLAHFDQHGCLNTFTEDKRTARSERRQLIEKLALVLTGAA